MSILGRGRDREWKGYKDRGEGGERVVDGGRDRFFCATTDLEMSYLLIV